MGWMEPENKNHVCPDGGQHHPINYVCVDPGCDCSRDTEDGRPYTRTTCHICNEGWPCTTKQKHDADRQRQAVIDESLSKLETVGEPVVHKGWPSTGRTCILAAPYEGHNIVFDGLYDWVTIFWEHGGGLSPQHKCTLDHSA